MAIRRWFTPQTVWVKEEISVTTGIDERPPGLSGQKSHPARTSHRPSGSRRRRNRGLPQAPPPIAGASPGKLPSSHGAVRRSVALRNRQASA
nr:hypothetical protein [Rhizobium leguminosarum]